MVSASTGRPAVSRTEVMFGRYRLVGRLAAGGMAEVWAAELVALGGFRKAMVIKRVLPELAENPSFLRMLMSEARVAARLSHMNICSVFELGEVDGEHYIAMEYLRGASLMDLMRTGPLAPPLAAAIVAQACEGLHYAHEQKDASGQLLGLVHRDVSPHNLFVTVDGVVKVLDFGIAKVDDGSSERTEAGKVKGKLPYMSPEQLAADPLDRRSDVWALGVVLWEALAGRRLFGGASPAFAVDAIRTATVPRLASVGVTAPGFDEVLGRAICRQREWRYANAAEMRRALLEALLPATHATNDLLAALVWDRAGDAIRAHDRMFADGGGIEDPGVVDRLPLRAEATEPSIELSFGSESDRSRMIAAREPTVLTDAPVTSPEVPAERGVGTDADRDRDRSAPSAAPRRASVEAVSVRPHGRWWIAVLGGAAIATAGIAIVKSAGTPAPEPAPAAIAPAAMASAPAAAGGAASTAPAPTAPTAPIPTVTEIHPAGEPPPPASAPIASKAPRAADRAAVERALADRAADRISDRRTAPHATSGKPGRLSIDASPWATISIDGKSLGATPLVGVELAAGDHTVKAVGQKGATKTFRIHIDPGATLRKKVPW
jgi:serine/threonine-protein kinase